MHARVEGWGGGRVGSTRKETSEGKSLDARAAIDRQGRRRGCKKPCALVVSSEGCVCEGGGESRVRE